jgi:HSP20 family protein
MAEVKIARTETPKYEVPFLGPDLYRTSMFGLTPFTLMRRFGDELERVFGKAGEAEMWRPAVDVKLEKGKMLVHADLPGLKKEEVKVTITGDLLAIEGERKTEKEEKKGGWIHTERNYGKFYRSIALPEGADAGKVTAEFADGVLAVTVPIPEIAAPAAKEIPVGDVKPKAEIKH